MRRHGVVRPTSWLKPKKMSIAPIRELPRYPAPRSDIHTCFPASSTIFHEAPEAMQVCNAAGYNIHKECRATVAPAGRVIHRMPPLICVRPPSSGSTSIEVMRAHVAKPASAWPLSWNATVSTCTHKLPIIWQAYCVERRACNVAERSAILGSQQYLEGIQDVSEHRCIPHDANEDDVHPNHDEAGYIPAGKLQVWWNTHCDVTTDKSSPILSSDARDKCGLQA